MSESTKPQEQKKHQGGRPKVESPRHIRIYTKLNEAEKRIVDERVKNTGMSRSEILRLLILHDELPDFYYRGLNPFAVKGYQNLQPLQSNLNQIAHELNRYAGARLSNQKLAQIVTQSAKHTRAVEQLVRHFRHELITKGDSRALT